MRARWAAVKNSFALLIACAALGACSASGPVAKEAKNTAIIAATNKPAPSANASGGPPANQVEAKRPPAVATVAAAPVLPTVLQGRWGLTPDDCVSTRGDAKGLLIVGPKELRFYESRALPTGDVHADGNSASGTFNFTGEGQTWTKYQALQLQKTLLVRTESNPTASFTYAKCS